MVLDRLGQAGVGADRGDVTGDGSGQREVVQRGEDGRPDLYEHYSEIAGQGFRSLEEGQKVKFEIGQGSGGQQVRAI